MAAVSKSDELLDEAACGGVRMVDNCSRDDKWPNNTQ